MSDTIRIECPDCGMPFDVPPDAERGYCDCGASWAIEGEQP